MTGVFVFRQSISSVRFGRGTGAIFFGYMSCGSSESSLQSCSRSSSSRYCSHDSDVGVWCDGIADSGQGMSSYVSVVPCIPYYDLWKSVSAFLCRFVTITSPTHYQTFRKTENLPCQKWSHTRFSEPICARRNGLSSAAKAFLLPATTATLCTTLF